MRKTLSKIQAREKIDNFFQKDGLDKESTRKLRRLAMKHRIKLGAYRKRFCKKCLSDLKNGKIRVGKTHKTIACKGCGYLNRFKL